ncbi:MAG: class I SAM-dependent methyltransferase [Deltaproteobacteria bacterium]|nr:class I SAM-dependent methyltransferase [Deltaproteobacteria bacterium]
MVRFNKTINYDIFRCPDSGLPLRLQDGALISPAGVRWPIVAGIPRFVVSDLYTDTFSFEWNIHFGTQLDSLTGGIFSEHTFIEKPGLDPDQVRGKLVLDAGVGAGRYADILFGWGANVIGVDLSYAVEAAFLNLHDRPNVIIAQADIGRLPFAPETFDLIVSIGTLHHTPDARSYFNRLLPLLKPGGEICIWVYPDRYDYAKRAAWIPFTNRIPIKWFYRWCRVFVPWADKHFNQPLVRIVSWIFPFSHQGQGVENDILDTFDGYSPKYLEIHNPQEVATWFRDAGLVNIRTFPWDTAVRGQRLTGSQVVSK